MVLKLDPGGGISVLGGAAPARERFEVLQGGKDTIVEQPAQLTVAELAAKVAEDFQGISVYPPGTVPEMSSSPLGIPRSIAADCKRATVPIAGLVVDHLKRRIFPKEPHINPAPDVPASMFVSGYLGPSEYMRAMVEATRREGWGLIRDQHFDRLRPRDKVAPAAAKHRHNLERREAPTVIDTHSKGVLELLPALIDLERKGVADTVYGVLVILGITHGVRDEVGRIAQFLPSRTIQEMCKPGNWQNELSPELLSRVMVISYPDGDTFTAPNNSFIEGAGVTVLHRNDGHIAPCMDPRTITFQFVTALHRALCESAETQWPVGANKN